MAGRGLEAGIALIRAVLNQRPSAPLKDHRLKSAVTLTTAEMPADIGMDMCPSLPGCADRRQIGEGCLRSSRHGRWLVGVSLIAGGLVDDDFADRDVGE